MSEATILINDARVLSKGQVTIPKNIREVLGVTTGDRVTFIFENGSVRVINSAIICNAKISGADERTGRESRFHIGRRCSRMDYEYST